LESEPIILLLLLIGGLVLLMMSGLPIAFCFLLMTLGGAIYFWGFHAGLSLLIHNIRSSISNFIFLPLLMFILLGDVMLESRLAIKMLDVMNKWLGRLPGRLALLTIFFCTIFSTMSGSQMATASMMGKTLTPEMERRGYKKAMSLGPIMGGGALDMIIPPSNLAVLLAAIAGISVGKLLIAGFIPGLLLASLYSAYIIIRCIIDPTIAPSYDVEPTPLSIKLKETGIYVFPVVAIIFLVMGLIFLGWATPTESAALGALGAFGVAALFGRFNTRMVSRCAMSTIRTAGMVLIIIACAQTYSQIVSFSGISKAVAAWVVGLNLSAIPVILLMMLILLVLGCFMDTVGMILVTMPIFMPVVISMKIDPIYFGIMVLINMALDGLTPPVGMMLYVVKAVAPPDTTMGDVIKASLPFLACDILAILLILVFPPIATWLPNLMMGAG